MSASSDLLPQVQKPHHADVSEDTNPPIGSAEKTMPNRGALPASFEQLSLRTIAFRVSEHAGDLGRIDRYRVLKQLGKGGMGAVYLGFDERLQRRVALKIMLPDAASDPQSKERFLREARAAAQIAHDNVIAIHEAHEADGLPFIAMQYLQGYPLDEYLNKKGRPSFPQIIRIAREIALGLGAAHKLGLVHRDIKPGNIWLEAPQGRVKILDFGLAKPVRSTANELTQSGTVVGTPAYMAPEQARGLSVDHRADLFSLGAVLYRLVTGRLPFDGPDVMAILTALAVEEPVPVWEHVPNVPRPLAELIHQLLAKKPAERPQTADEVSARLHSMMERQTNPHSTTIAGGNGSAQQVVFVPVPVTVLDSTDNAFAHLEEEEATAAETPSAVGRAKKVKTSSKLLIGLLLGGFLMMLVGGFILIKVVNKDGTTTELKVPDDAKVTVEKHGKKVFDSGKHETKKPVDPAVSIDYSPFKPLDAAWLKTTAAIPQQDVLPLIAEELKKRNPQYDGTKLEWANDPLTNTKTGIVLAFDATVSDLMPLLALPNLECLSVIHTGGSLSPLTNLTPLRGLKKLRTLRLEGHLQLTDLSPLENLPLEQLTLRDCRVESLAPLKSAKLDKLELLNTPIRELSPLASMPLRTLVFGHTDIILDLTPLASCPLERVQFDWGRGHDLTPLKKCPLKSFAMIYTAQPDLSPLEGSGIEHFSGFDPVQYESFLRTLPKLETISSCTMRPISKEAYFKECENNRKMNDEFATETAKLPVQDQIAAVKKRFAERNEGKKSGFSVQIEKDRVVGVTFDDSDPASAVWNLGFLRGFPHLKRIDARTFGYTPLFHQVLDLPIEEVQVNDTNMHHSKNLHSYSKMKSLKAINGKSFDLFSNQWNLFPTGRGIPSKVNTPLDPDWIKRVRAALPGDQLKLVVDELKARNPEFTSTYSECAFSSVDGSVASLRFHGVKFTDLSPLTVLQHLELLEIAGPPDSPLANIAPLGQMPKLFQVELRNHSNLKDISPLATTTVRHLDLEHTAVVTLTPLKTFPLQKLSIIGTPIPDLSPLAGMPLRTLAFGYTPQTKFDLAPLAKLNTLETLRIGGGRIENLEPLRGLKLKAFRSDATAFADLSPLANHPLESFTMPDAEQYLEFVRAHSAIREVYCRRCNQFHPKIQYLAGVERRNREDDEFLTSTIGRSQVEIAELVQARLRKLTNCPNLQLTTTSDANGQVIGAVLSEIDLRFAELAELGALRAFPKLRQLQVQAETQVPLYQLGDLPLEEIQLSDHSGNVSLNRAAFAKMKSLKKINGKTVAEFLK